MKPKIQIVDKNDDLVGHKERNEVDYTNDIYRVAALWLSNSRGDVLIAQRKKTKDKDPGKWGPAVAGTVDEGETYEQNIYKEAEEEIGLIGVSFVKGPKLRVNNPRNYFVQWYTVIVDKDISEFVPQEEEVEELKWVPKEKLSKDVEESPDLYISTMRAIVDTFSK